MYFLNFVKDFSVENLEITPKTFLSRFSCEIYLSRIMNYWGIILHYIEREERSISIFFLSFFSFSFSVGIFLDKH